MSRGPDVHTRLLRRLASVLDGIATLASSDQQPWASVTFSGHRHRFRYNGDLDAIQRCDLDAIEFEVPGILVADVALQQDASGEVIIEVLAIDNDG